MEYETHNARFDKLKAEARLLNAKAAFVEAVTFIVKELVADLSRVKK